MNKYQEAINRLWDFIELHSNDFHKDLYDSLEDLQELVDEKTPMKPIVYNINQFKCPKCLKQIKGKKMIYNMGTKRFDIKSKIKVEKVYCPYCSQKLDWSDTDD